MELLRIKKKNLNINLTKFYLVKIIVETILFIMKILKEHIYEKVIKITLEKL